MGLIHIDLFSTVDGVAQAPGAPEEDPSGGFAFGGWQAPSSTRRSAHRSSTAWRGWTPCCSAGAPSISSPPTGRGRADRSRRLFDRIPKYVASRGTASLAWSGSAQLGADLAAAVAELRERHRRIHVIGSLDLVQTLLHEQLFDRLTLWVHLILLGEGKRVFAHGAVPSNLRLLEPAVTSPGGVVRLRYERVAGVPSVGVMGP